MEQAAQFRDSFLVETNKLLDECGAILLANESKKALSIADVNEIFRIMHTIKGSAGMMGLTRLSAVTHALEELFVLLKREDELPPGRAAALFDLLFQALDALKNGIGDFAKGGAESRGYDALLQSIAAFQTGGERLQTLRITLSPECVMENVRAFLIVSTLHSLCPSLSHYPSHLDTDGSASGKIRAQGLYIRFPSAYGEAIRQELRKDPYVQAEEEAEAFPSDCPAPAEPTTPESGREPSPAADSDPMEQYVSVRLSRLAELQNLTSELILAQSPLLADRSQTDPDALRLKRLAETLRSAVTSLRMTPLTSLFQKLHRTVRDAGRRLGREIAFTAAGTDVEVDKSMTEAVAESLIQIVRNAAVHGIESPEERLNAGKPLMGTIAVSAQNAGASVTFSVTDDGRGISAEKVYQSALKSGQLMENAPASPEELLRLLMRPGVTTSAQADEMSGRGVGLDVVRTTVEKLRGTVEMETRPGVGTTFTLRIPQSLVVMDCVGLGAGDGVFLLPASDLYTLVQPRQEELVQCPDGRQMLQYRGYALPVLDLGAFYRVRREPQGGAAGVLAILEGEQSAVALYAHRLLGMHRVAMKPLPTLLEALGMRDHGISGCAILSDGSIGLVLNACVLLGLKEGAIP